MLTNINSRQSLASLPLKALNYLIHPDSCCQPNIKINIIRLTVTDHIFFVPFLTPKGTRCTNDDVRHAPAALLLLSLDWLATDIYFGWCLQFPDNLFSTRWCLHVINVHILVVFMFTHRVPSQKALVWELPVLYSFWKYLIASSF